MKIFKTKSELRAYLDKLPLTNKIGFVPTMGALHEGHLSLIEEAKKYANTIVCSIFVNPTQFNDPSDLEKYPRPIEHDISLLTSVSCDILFLPSVEEMYPTHDEKWELDLGKLDRIWEGEHRPGHFQGVTQIVYKLFQAVQPHIACFGQKDFQQIMVIQKMIEIKNLPVEIIICPIIRNEEGLALSSRNARLSNDGKLKALVISRALRTMKAQFDTKSPQDLIQEGIEILQSEADLKIEYLAICETSSLSKVDQIDPFKKYITLVVVWIEGVRLIDNMLMNP